MKISFKYEDPNPSDIQNVLKLIYDRYKNDDTVIKSLNIYLSIQNEDGEILIPVDENGEEVEWVVRNKLGKNNRKLIEDKNLTLMCGKPTPLGVGWIALNT